jgi:RHS repeat-associated protein
VQELNGKHNAAVVANLLTGLGIDEYFTRTDTATGVTSTLLADALGSTIGLVTSNNGPIATNYTYQPFGATTSGGAANGSAYQFTGRENDGTGLYFYRARYYSPAFQRFVAQDPIGFRGGDANVYGYAFNSPSNLVDPNGEELSGFFLGLISGGIGGYTGSGGTWQGAVLGAAVGGVIGLLNPIPASPFTAGLTSGVGNLAGQFTRNLLNGRDLLNRCNYNIWTAGLATFGGYAGASLAGDIAESGSLLTTFDPGLDNAILKGFGSGLGASIGNSIGNYGP